MILRIKRLLHAASPPKRGIDSAAGWDFTAVGRTFLRSEDLFPIHPRNASAGDLVKYNTGLALEIPKGHVGLAFARSSICKMPLILSNGTGVIDADYRGELSFIYRILDPVNIEHTSYKEGERYGQLVLVQHDEPEFEMVEELSDTARGINGYGSTGK